MSVKFHEGILEITSYNNGLAYAVLNRASGGEFFVQGDDAAQFREEVLSQKDPEEAYHLNGYAGLETTGRNAV